MNWTYADGIQDQFANVDSFSAANKSIGYVINLEFENIENEEFESELR